MPSGKLILLSPDGSIVKEDVPTVKTATKLATEHASKEGKHGTYKVVTLKAEITTSEDVKEAPKEVPAEDKKKETYFT